MTLPWICIAPNVPGMVLRGQVVKALDPDDNFYKGRIDAIDFTLEGFIVSAKRVRGVAAAVKEGRIGVEVADTGANFGAAYTLGQSRHFTLREYVFQPNDFWRAQIVHEAVHASFDLAGESPANEPGPRFGDGHEVSGAPRHRDDLGSSASRRPSPNRLNASTVRNSARPGAIRYSGSIEK